MVKYLIILIILVSGPSWAGVVWETNFDNYPDWESGETLTGTLPGTIYDKTDEGKSIKTVTGGDFDCYRSSRGVLSDNNGKKTYQIVGDHAYGGTGKALDCWYESSTSQVGGGFGIHLGATGYDEIYLRWRMKFDDDWRNGTASGLAEILKLYRLMSNVDSAWDTGGTDPMNMYQSPSTRPDWLDNCYPDLNSSDECGKQGYVILRWQQTVGFVNFDKIAYNPEGRAGSVSDLTLWFDGEAVDWRVYHAKEITSNILPTASTYPTNDWVGNGEWHTYETRTKHNTPGSADGVFELWMDGVKVGQVSNMETRTSENTKFNYVIIPDNFHNVVYPEQVASTEPHAEQLFVVDDIVISTEYVGTEYMISSTVPTITNPGDISQTETSYSLSTSYTIEEGRTVASSTWSSDQGPSGSLTASGGTLSGIITDLVSGANIITLLIADSESETGTTQFTINITTTKTCYLDADNDGYSDGISETGVETCSTNYYESGDLIATSGDCNDNSSEIHPNATEICGDGIDNDCSDGDETCSVALTSGCSSTSISN